MDDDDIVDADKLLKTVLGPFNHDESNPFFTYKKTVKNNIYILDYNLYDTPITHIIDINMFVDYEYMFTLLIKFILCKTHLHPIQGCPFDSYNHLRRHLSVDIVALCDIANIRNATLIEWVADNEGDIYTPQELQLFVTYEYVLKKYGDINKYYDILREEEALFIDEDSPINKDDVILRLQNAIYDTINEYVITKPYLLDRYLK
jgi:hypothetical protein